ncbi:hypothetical protein N24_0092 [Corynebacterium suranareeae]|uniref:Secreted protein n=1 Tax=Corynebacterium suranareeae TaxID=2506452 RepID=A0A160PM84_9CORY|nr:hypothetical protein [Corynebacterium suranareeae]BAU94354.1 hypothetical protein N24_0092 [Corynebacterium suranareeae]
MLKFSARAFSVLACSTIIAISASPTSHAAVGALLNQVPQGEISCATAEAYWTNDADYQAKVAQAQALAAFDERGNQILAALAQVDAAAENCGLKGTVGNGAVPSEEGAVGTPNTEATESPAASSTPNVPSSPSSPDTPLTDPAAVFSPTQSAPTKTIEVLGQGQVEVPDAEGILKNYLRQLTIIV